jgi:hypothetical protein
MKYIFTEFNMQRETFPAPPCCFSHYTGNNLKSFVFLQSVTVCYSVLQSVTVCYSVLQCVTVCYSLLQSVTVCYSLLQCVTVCYSVLQSVTVCYSVLQSVTAHNFRAQQQIFPIFQWSRHMHIQIIDRRLVLFLLKMTRAISLPYWSIIYR